MSQDASLEQDIKELMLKRREKPHPPQQQLLDYHDRMLGAEEAERVRDHLSVCPACTHTVLEWGEAFTPEEKESTFEAIQRRIRERDYPQPLEEPNPVIPVSMERNKVRAPWIARTAAAGFALAFVVLWLLDTTSNEPFVNVSEVELISKERTGGGRPEPGSLTVITSSRPSLLLFSLIDSTPNRFDTYTLSIVDASDSVVWESGTLTRTADGDFSLLLPAGFLRAGHYEIHVAIPGEQTASATYALEVTP